MATTTPLPLVQNVYQVTTLGTLNGMPCDHVVNWFALGGIANIPAVVEAFASTDSANWVAQMGTLLPTDYIHVGSKCVYLGDTTTTPVEVSTQAAGTSTDAFGPYFSAVTWRWPAPGRGKGKDGRTNMPGPPSPLLGTDHHSLTTAGLTSYTNAFNAYFAAIQSGVRSVTGTNPEVVILSRKKGTYSSPTGGQVDTYVNVHRRWVKRLARH